MSTIPTPFALSAAAQRRSRRAALIFASLVGTMASGCFWVTTKS